MDTGVGLDNLLLLHRAIGVVKALKKGSLDADARASLERWLDEAIAQLKADAKTRRADGAV